ncbi:MAG: N-acetyl-alpha-D-glucosaminyl L-malate synthase BshA [Flavobacteriaceae bacterium]|nr:N-acetyl-alpha-D-glucosaminyl L-malate synthase BshA [Flavobacteriaceae bacterium]
MKIAIVCYPTYGGSGVVATELGHSLSMRGHEIHFITYKQPVRLDTLNKNIHFHEVFVPEYDLFHYQPYELALSSRIVDVVKAHNIDVLHVHYAIPHAYAAYMSKMMLRDIGIGLPIVTTLHGTDITLVGSHPFYRSAVTFSINNSDYVTSVSKSLKDDTESLFDINKSIDVIPNFIDVNKHAHLERPCHRESVAENKEKVITHISNFRPLKRVKDVVKVFEIVQRDIPSKLLMVGEGPERIKAQRYVKKHNLSDKVLFLGKSNEINELLCYSDIFLLPSEKESFGLVALEAMIHKVPVISSNAGGLSEVNIDGESGYLSPVGDVKEMAKNAIKILKDENEFNRLKEGAFRRAKIFDISNIIPKYELIYKKALDGSI